MLYYIEDEHGVQLFCIEVDSRGREVSMQKHWGRKFK